MGAYLNREAVNIPYTQTYDYQEESTAEGTAVEFRLIYQGKLPSESHADSRVKDKHRIRRIFHKQIADFYTHNPYLRKWTIPRPQPDGSQQPPLVEAFADEYQRCGYRFLPLVNESRGVSCSLDILFLRRDAPGHLVTSGGDIDNRIKVLFDGLRMPKASNEIDGAPQEGEDPFYCLLEDDSLITRVNVTTDRLLTPKADDEHIHDVVLVIHVKTIVVDTDKAFLPYY
jgi:hypothetical protein